MKWIALLLPGVVALVAWSAPRQEASQPKGKYVGAKACKNCHRAKSKGAQFTKWGKQKHAKAFEALASDEAKKIAKEKCIEDPQKDPKCLKCHVTAFGVEKKFIDRKFDPKLGVQCEACHGPADKHVKNRLMSEDDEKKQYEDAKKEMPLPAKDLCLKCHNEESPTIARSKYWDAAKKRFDYEKAWKEIEHPNPKRMKK